MTKQTIIFRADADATIGTGHVMRSFALATELIRKGIEVVFITTGNFPALETRLKSAGITLYHIDVGAGSVEDAKLTCTYAKKLSARWIVTDGYNFTENFQKNVKTEGFLLLVIDDFGHSERYYADIILNQYPYAAENMYPNRDLATILLLGTRYALLRREFLINANVKPEIPSVAERILVTLGGSDPGNFSGLILKALQQLPVESVEIKVIVGACNPYYDDLKDLANQTRHKIELLTNVENMADLCNWADCAITGGGSTTLELACLGIPMITIVIADNQIKVCESLEKADAAINLGQINDEKYMKLPDFLNNFFHNRKKREELSENSRHLVDGRGAERVSIFLVESLLQVRKARADDCWMIYHWANDPYIREISFNTSPISPEEHKDWFFSQIRNPNVMYFILENKDCIPVGQVRFDIDDNNATISIIIAPEFRGINYGTRAMLFSSEILFNQSDVQYIHAFIKKNNTVSYKAFKRAGYRDSGICWKDSFEAHHLIFERV